jgi:hypothetical protein
VTPETVIEISFDDASLKSQPSTSSIPWVRKGVGYAPPTADRRRRRPFLRATKQDVLSALGAGVRRKREQIHQILHADALQRAHGSRDFLAQPPVRPSGREIVEFRLDVVPGERPCR